MEIESFIVSVVKRPAMFYVNNVEDINLIILGFVVGAKDLKTNNLMDDFRFFVNKDFKSKNDVDWPRLIRFHSASDLHSLELFSQLFNRFWEMYPNK